jgi:hypothetical protein
MNDEIQADRSAKHWLKVIRWKIRRRQVAWKWGVKNVSGTPAVLGNAMPKSGSHLIIQVLQGLTRVGPFVNPGFPPVNRAEDNRKLDGTAILKNIEQMEAGDIRYGYIHARQPFIAALTNPGKAMVFVYRDPRDMLVSHVFYATQMHPGHGMHRYYTEVLSSMEERLNAAIQGVDEEGAELSNVKQRYLNYLGWLEIPDTLCLRFEDLVLDQEASFNRLLSYLESRGMNLQVSQATAIGALKSSIAPHKSGTFRKGKPGSWREYFTPQNKRLFKEVAGDLLIQMGYEKDLDW